VTIGFLICLVVFQVGVCVFQLSTLVRMQEQDKKIATLLRQYADIQYRCIRLEQEVNVLREDYQGRYPGADWQEDVRITNDFS
jgi:hypothetical protein